MSAPIRRGDRRGRGAAAYQGPQVRCAHWRDQLDLRGRHAAVVGGGAAVAQVLPPILAQARRVTVFQRDPVWVLPTPPLPGVRELVRLLPEDLLGLLPSDSAPPLPGDPGPESPAPSGRVAHRLTRSILHGAASLNLRVQVRDSWQRRQLTPDTTAGVRVHGRYYRALQDPRCTLVTWPIARLAALGIRTVDGIEHRVDCIIYAEELA
ncbi:hypothetical protein [Nocardia yamanashiensis]|uniref:hypothetical protein n=1 Tax=Nocardia yamanashiensis TaxID=209247 RepID=UPI00082E6016|nr:hypothetical protein [Nocardia yamanashiensis]